MAEQSFLSAFLEDNPDVLFQGMLPQEGSPAFLDWSRRQYGRMQGGFLGEVGRSALAGRIPEQTFRGFLGTGPWMRYWQQMSPTERGERPSLFAPRTRWNV